MNLKLADLGEHRSAGRVEQQRTMERCRFVLNCCCCIGPRHLLETPPSAFNCDSTDLRNGQVYHLISPSETLLSSRTSCYTVSIQRPQTEPSHSRSNTEVHHRLDIPTLHQHDPLFATTAGTQHDHSRSRSLITYKSLLLEDHSVVSGRHLEFNTSFNSCSGVPRYEPISH